jgi:hypothetical protein
MQRPHDVHVPMFEDVIRGLEETKPVRSQIIAGIHHVRPCAPNPASANSSTMLMQRLHHVHSLSSKRMWQGLRQLESAFRADIRTLGPLIQHQRRSFFNSDTLSKIQHFVQRSPPTPTEVGSCANHGATIATMYARCDMVGRWESRIVDLDSEAFLVHSVC